MPEILASPGEWAQTDLGVPTVWHSRFSMTYGEYDFELSSTADGSWSVAVRRLDKFVDVLPILSGELGVGNFEDAADGSIGPTVATVKAMGSLLVRAFLGGVKSRGGLIGRARSPWQRSMGRLPR